MRTDMRAGTYAKALNEALKEHPHSEEKLVAQFVKTVADNGDAYQFPKILKSFERITAKEAKATTIEVTSAKLLSEEKVVALLKKDPFKNALSIKHKKVVRKTDPEIVGGVIVRTGTVKIDASYKRALLDVYQSLITNL